jgi:hypothetical protein
LFDAFTLREPVSTSLENAMPQSVRRISFQTLTESDCVAEDAIELASRWIICSTKL